MELADTSAWTNRQKHPQAAEEFARQLRAGQIATCEMVRLELLWTARDAADFVSLEEELEALERVPITQRAWDRAVGIFGELAACGPLHHRQISIPDALIAAAAEEAGLRLLHYDRDFELIARVTGQPVRAIAPLGSL